jgi:hypothetical protein
MNISIQQAEKLLKSNKPLTQVSFSMMVTRLRMLFLEDSSPSKLQSYTNEINAFLKKYEALLSADYTTIINM